MVIATYTITPRSEWTPRHVQAPRSRYLLRFGYRGFRTTLAVALIAGGAAVYTLRPDALGIDAGSPELGSSRSPPVVKARIDGESVAIADQRPPAPAGPTAVPLPWLLNLNADEFSPLAANPSAASLKPAKTTAHGSQSKPGGSGGIAERALGKPAQPPMPERGSASPLSLDRGDAHRLEGAASASLDFAAAFPAINGGTGSPQRLAEAATPPTALQEAPDAPAPTTASADSFSQPVEHTEAGTVEGDEAPAVAVTTNRAEAIGLPDSVAPAEIASPPTTAGEARSEAISLPAGPELADPRVEADSNPGTHPDREPAVLSLAETTSASSALATPRERAAAPWTQKFPVVIVNGDEVGAVTLHDFASGTQSIHLGTLLSLFKLKMHAAEFARLSASTAAAEFVTLDQLRSAGLEVEYQARQGIIRIHAE